jgi:translation initiation factor 1
MRPEPKKRIDTTGTQNPLASLGGAFAGVNLPELPAGSESPAPSANEPPAKLGRVVLRRETAHRGGKTVIVIHDFATHLTGSELERLAKKIRSACGCGGTVRDRTIEIQGDQPEKIRGLLEAEGFRVAGI